jgi:hypothetical protein
MCTTEYYQSLDCQRKCRWLEIGIPCGAETGFNNCDIFEGRHTNQRPRSFHMVRKDRCPRHGLMNSYDPNRVTMIKDIKYCVCM